VDEGNTGIPEEQVRLDEVLADPGDKLYYEYDFGDGWEHVLKLETVSARTAPAPRALCTNGRRDGPAEDCGGVFAYELSAAAAGPGHADHAEAAAEWEHIFGRDVDPEAIHTTRFDISEINTALAAAFPATTLSGGACPRRYP
jgi:Plasmid pRiA4b ORF-3-like protein